jgi:hypothetical protein
MKNMGQVVALAILGLVAGAVIGEFFPTLFTSGLVGSIGSAVSEPFSQYRNEIAVKYGLFGAGIGAAIGLILSFMAKK